MSRLFNKNLFAFLFSSLVLVFWFRWQIADLSSSFTPFAVSPPVPEIPKGFDIFTDGCKIPSFDPFDASISHVKLVGKENSGGDCSNFERHLDSIPEKNVAFVKNESLAKLKAKFCEWAAVIRGDESDSSWDWSKSTRFNADEKVRISADFALVKCYNDLQQMVLAEFVVLGFENSLKIKEKKILREKHETIVGIKNEFDVFLVGIDSVSKNNFIRNLPKTRKYLMENLNPIEFHGYNKVADNTLVNFIPFLTGKYLKDLPWDETKSKLPWDNYPFIWKNFSDRGYWTLYGEDYFSISTFNYIKEGFHQQPTDHYFRPFLLAYDKYHKLDGVSGTKCFGNQTQGDWLYDWFFNVLRSRDVSDRTFALLWSNSWSHEELHATRAADEPTLRLFKRLNEANLLSNAIVFFFSDHGFRFGEIRETFAGKFEERLPFLYVLLPERLRRSRPELVANLETNSRRLTTNFDLYETMVHLLDMGTGKKRGSESNPPLVNGTKFRYSLFDEIPTTRSCASATIKRHWCTCQTMRKVVVESKMAIDVGNFIIERINEVLKHRRNICQFLTLKKIKSAFITESPDYYLKFRALFNDVLNQQLEFQPPVRSANNFVVVVEASPGGGVFEGTVRVWEAKGNHKGSMSLEGEISRINLYGQTSHCVEEARLKKYCYCKNDAGD